MKLAVIALLLFLAAWAPSSRSPTTHGAAPAPPVALYVLPANLPVAVSARLVCRLTAGNPSAEAATVLGVDGAASVAIDGVDYWFFGDTFRRGPAGRRDVIPAGFATSSDFDGRDCVDLTFKTDTDGIVQPMFPRADEATAWPDGVLPLPDGSVAFYMVKTYRQSPTQWNIGAIGLGVLPAHSVDGVRTVERIWDADSGFRGTIVGARSPVRVGDDVLVYINTDAGTYLARAPIARMGEAEAYTYWSGAGWSGLPRDAQPMWTAEPSVLPADNGLSVSFDDASGKWMAVYNADLWRVDVRLADQPSGPWSEPITWFDCQAFSGADYPYCYSSALHSELTRDNGATVYVTFANPQPYDVALVELHLGVAIHGWVDEGNGERLAAAAPTASAVDAGVAFYASTVPWPGLAPIYEAVSGGEYRYTIFAPSPEAQPLFFAYDAPTAGAVHTQPVYRWRRDGREALDPADRDGWVRAGVAFYVPAWTP